MSTLKRWLTKAAQVVVAVAALPFLAMFDRRPPKDPPG